MAIGERIKYLRQLRGLTQKQLGLAAGFDEKTADIRIAQYESGIRTPKEAYARSIAAALSVDEKALSIPDIDRIDGLLHTLFTLEDFYGLRIERDPNGILLRFQNGSLEERLAAWQEQAQKCADGTISEESYNDWRYSFSSENETTMKPTGSDRPKPVKESVRETGSDSTALTYDLPIALL